MALSPNAPDYVSQVRGVINDLRQNYVQKQQLFQQAQQAQAQIGLGYAQLAAQRDNQARQADLDERRIEVQSLQNQRELESLAFNRQRQAASDLLDRQKFDLLQEEKNQKMREIESKNREEAESGRLYSVVRDARLSGDPEKIAEAEGQLDNAALSANIKGQILDRLDIADARRLKLQTDVDIKQKRPQVNEVLAQAANLPIDRMLPDDAQDALNNLYSAYQEIGSPDPDAANKLNAIFSQKQAQLLKLRDDVTIQGIAQLVEDGAQENFFSRKYPGPDGVAFQKRYDEITKGVPKEQRDKDPTIFSRLKGLAADIHLVDSQEALNNTKARFIIAQENLVKKNPALGIETIDPATGDKRVTFAAPMPNMTLGPNDVDLRTGKITKEKQREIEQYQSVLDRTLAGDFNPLNMLLGRTINQSPTAKSSNAPFIPNDPYATTAQIPVAPTGTAVVRTGTPTAPSAQTTRPSDEEILKMAEDPKTANMIVPGSGKKRTYKETADFLKSEQNKNVATPNSY
jgi:hypothetical protein